MRYASKLAAILISLGLACAYADPVQIVAFGGSNTFGKGVAREDAYPAQLERMLKEDGYDVVVRNEGTNGQTTTDELGKLDSIAPEGTNIVIFQPGGNDGRVSAKHGLNSSSEAQANVREIVKKLLDRKVKVLVSGADSKLAAVNDLGVPTIGEISRLSPENFAGDYQHLTPEGYRVVAEKIKPIVEQMLTELGARRR